MTLIRDLALPAWVALIGLAAGGWLYHSVREHHVHLVIARMVNPGIVVPVTRHDTGWHAMSHRARAGINAVMLAAAACLGLAWHAERTATAAGVTLCLGGFAVWLGIRALSRSLGQRCRVIPGPDPDQE